MVDHPCLPDATFSVIKADGTTELRKFRTPGDDASAGAVGKIGARHSRADKDRIKQSHDLLVALDPDCCAAAHIPGANVDRAPGLPAGKGTDESAGAGETEKLAKSFERSLAKAVAGITVQLNDMAARMKKIEDQPLPLGTTSVRVAEKTDDALFPRPAALLDQPGALEALAEAAIRKAQSQPMRAIPGFRPRRD